jgi:hypothetical protein
VRIDAGVFVPLMHVDPEPPSSLPPAPPPPPPPPPPPAASEPRNVHGETLAEAEAAVLALVQGGMLGADALALHPLPPGTSAAEALRFLASLPQTAYVVGEPGGTVVGPPIGRSGAVPPTSDAADLQAAEAEALANHPNLGDVPGFELEDPFGERTLAGANPPLKAGAAYDAMVGAGLAFGVDPLAIVANALHEGPGGAIGDSGGAYGPFQDHLTDFPSRPFYGKGHNNTAVNAWAWSENGIAYSVRQMALGSPSARNLTGHSAVYAIVNGYERPGDRAGAFKTRAAEYDKLLRLGAGARAYAAGLLHGPIAGGAVNPPPAGGGGGGAGAPPGLVATWRDLVDVFKVAVPSAHDKTNAAAKALKGVFR